MKKMSQISYQTEAAVTAEELSQVFKASGIKRPVDDLGRLDAMIKHADLLYSAWDGDKLIGVARAITDYSYCCYLSDLAVDADYHAKGIGKHLVEMVGEHIGEEVALILLSSPTAMGYYPKIGFEKIENGYIIKRKS